MSLNKLIATRTRLIRALEEIEAVLGGPRPQSAEKFTTSRWNFAREVMLYFTNDEATVLVPLIGDRRPEVVR